MLGSVENEHTQFADGLIGVGSVLFHRELFVMGYKATEEAVFLHAHYKLCQNPIRSHP